jgi:putative transposase
MGRSRYKITDPQLPHFVTCTVLHWIPVFTRSAAVDIVLDSLRHLVSEGLTVYVYVILENHRHLVVQSPVGRVSDSVTRHFYTTYNAISTR